MRISFAGHEDDVPYLAELINRVYADGEKGLWAEGARRTGAAEVADLIGRGELVLARGDDRVIGAVRVQRLGDKLGEFGMLVADPAHRGAGVGRELVAFAEGWARRQGLTTMQLELLTPRTWTHPVKEFLRGWYTRIGYRQVRTEDFASAYPALEPLLATPCDFVVYHKGLQQP
nr:GNAT family N-acetyltransferase [uncultured Actinoplanes sp.]